MNKKILLICLGIICSLSSYSQRFQFLPPDNYDQRTNSYTIATAGSYPIALPTTQHTQWATISSNPSAYAFKSIQDYVEVGINHDTTMIVPTAYKYSVTCSVRAYTHNAPTTANIKTFTLEISYDPDSLDPYTDLAVFKFSGFLKADVWITDVKDAAGTTVPKSLLAKNFYIRSRIDVERYDNTAFTIYPQCSAANNNLTITWGTATSAPACGTDLTTNTIQPLEYELEWIYIDDYEFNTTTQAIVHKFSSGPVNYDFRKNSTRVRLKNNSFTIPLVYEQGAIVYRLRALKPDATQNYKDITYGSWTLADQGSLSTSDPCFRRRGYVITTPHNSDNLNWQYTINFAEDGKYKHVINYFDGSLKNRQTQTKINTDNSYIIAVDKVYDYEGHVAIQTLPSPFQQQYLGYRDDIARNNATNAPYRPQELDGIRCGAPDSLPPVSTGSVAGQYYSSSNPIKSGVQRFVPDAKGYPFIQSIYSSDNLLLWQGGAGKDHQPWKDHGTRYEYARATQPELDQYFGTEAGKFEFFPKQVISDPNGQTSFSIFNKAGQTVATGLIGLPDTITTPIEAIASDYSGTSFCFDVLANFTQDRLYNGLSANTNFYVEKNANHSLQYRVTIPPFSPGCNNGGPKYILAKGYYNFSGTDDCGNPKIPYTFDTVGYDKDTNIAYIANYSTPTVSGFLTKGKYTIDKRITFNKYEVNNRVKAFVKSNEPICYNDEKWYVKATVEERTFPCVDSPALSPCEARKRQMIKEMWPNEKYGQYDKNGLGAFDFDTVCLNGQEMERKPVWRNYNSIFSAVAHCSTTLSVCNAVTPLFWIDPACLHFRYQDACVTLPTSVVKNGKTYTNLATLPVDTFIYIFNDQIAEKLLPLHPEYCKLGLCDDGTFITQLEGFESQKQAVQGNRFKLDSIISNDPMYIKATPIDKPILKQKLSHFKNLADKRLDELAIQQAYCSAGNAEEAAHCAKFLYTTEITSFTFLDSAVKQRYYEIMKGYYLVNRTYILQRMLDSAGTACQPCSSVRMTLIAPPAFPPVFASNGNGFDPSLGVPSWLNTLFTNINDPSYNLSTLTTPTQIQDSVNANKNRQTASQLDNIMNELKNCSVNADTLDSIKAKLAFYTNQGITLTPSLITTAITGAGVTITDLCHSFLVLHNIFNNSNETEYKYDCGKPALYTGLKGFISRTDVINTIKASVLAGSSTASFNLDVNNEYENKIASKLGIANNGNVTIQGFLDTIKYSSTVYYKFVKLKISASGNNVYVYLKRKLSASPYLDGASTITVSDALCLNNDNAASDGYEAAYTAVADLVVNGSVGAHRYYVWSKDIQLMTDPANKVPLEAITCVAIKNALKQFKADKTTYGYDDAANHPLFEKTVTNYLNYKLGTRFTFTDYSEHMKGCAVTDSVEIRKYYATIKVDASTTTIADSIAARIKRFTGREVIATRIKYTASGNTVIGVDLNAAPSDSLLVYKKAIQNIAVNAGGTQSYLAIEPVKVFDKSGCSPAIALSTYGSFISAACTVYYSNGSKQVGNIYTYNSSYANALAHANMMSNTASYKTQCGGSFTIPDAALMRNGMYSAPVTQGYLAYVYGLEGKTKQEIRDSIATTNLKARIAIYSGKEVQYDDPYCSKAKKDLYVYSHTQATHPGSVLLNSTIIAQANAALGSTRLFMPAGTLTGGNSTIKIFRKANGVHWYRFFDGNNKLYNAYIQPPANAPFSLSTLKVDGIKIGPGTDSIYRFTVYMHYDATPTEVIECKGYTDFPLGYGQRIPNVLLYEKPGLNYCLDSIDCEYNMLQDAIYTGKVRYRQAYDSTVTDLTEKMYTHLLTNTKDSIFLCAYNQKNMVTLYYYDLNGNLRKTVPPAGVSTTPANHSNITKYEYDTRNLVVKQNTPDAWDTKFYYDGAGRLVFSQNNKQFELGRYSYTLYDRMNRATETGEVKLVEPNVSTPPVYVTQCYNHALYPMDSIIRYMRTKTRTDVVVTTYDTMKTNIGSISGEHLSTQENLLNRVSTIAFFQTKGPDYHLSIDNTTPSFATYYSYDMVGNVKTVSYNCPAMIPSKQQYKRVDYDYDQISGKVNMISYNRSRADQFYQRYEYDADNRITKAETSNDGVIWNRDAEYTYYKHGPLANAKIGAWQIQSIDYAYTIQGWLKAINGDVLRYDKTMQPNPALAQTTYARDVIAHAIDYFGGDYLPIDNTATVTSLSAPARNLYNGNIVRTTTAISGLGNQRGIYNYDQAHRLTKARYETINESTLTANAPSSIYKNSYTYNEDGDIQKLVRYDGNAARIDSIVYGYSIFANTGHKLYDAKDYQSNATGAGTDFQQGQNSNNYEYDRIGNLKLDKQGHIKMDWNLYGKLRMVEDTLSTQAQKIYYEYDGLGNRVRKEIIKKMTGYDESHKGEYYVRDASGNILATYRFNSVFSRISLIAVANDGVVLSPHFPSWVNDKIKNFGTLGPAIATKGLSVIPAWVDAQIDRPLSYYLNYDGGLYTQILNGPLAPNYFTDLKMHDIAHPDQQIFATAMSSAVPELMPIFDQVITKEMPGRKMLEHFDAQMLPMDMDNMWMMLGMGEGRDPMNHNMNATNLYNFMTMTGRKMDVLMQMTNTLNNNNMMHEGIQSRAFLNNMMHDDEIVENPELRMPGSPFINQMQAMLQNHGNSEQITTFFNEWPGSATWLDVAVPATERFELVYNEAPDAILGDYLANLPDVTSFDTMLADIPGLDAYDYLTARNSGTAVIDMGPVDIMKLYTFGAVVDTTDLMEHHIYSGTRLGVQQYAPLQYRQTFNINSGISPVTGISNPTTWYSGHYSDLIWKNQKEPWGNQFTGTNDTFRVKRMLGYRHYELTDHLGNVLATVLDRKTGHNPGGGATTYDYWVADISSEQDYYPFGMRMTQRHKEVGDSVYRFGYNGKHKDNDVYGSFNHYDYALRVYDPRIARFLSTDPITKDFPWFSPYQYAGNSPILNVDVEGAEPHPYFLLPSWAKPIAKVLYTADNAIERANATADGYIRAHKYITGKEPGIGLKISAYVRGYLSQGAGDLTDQNDMAVLAAGKNLDGTTATRSDKNWAAAGVFVPLASGAALKKVGGPLIEGFVKIFKNGDEVAEKAYKVGNYGHVGSAAHRQVVKSLQGGGNFVVGSKEEAVQLLKTAFPGITQEAGGKASKFGYRIDEVSDAASSGLKQGHQGTHINFYDKDSKIKGTIQIEK